MDRELLLEIGCEEIPASWLQPLTRQLGERLAAELESFRISAGASVETHATPRRLMAGVARISERQTDLDEQVTGPAVPAAFGPDGQPTPAAIGFAKRGNVEPSALTVVETAKGKYVAYTKHERGKATVDVLPDVLGPTDVAGEWAETGAIVAPGTGDNMAAALGLGLRPGDLVLSLGTSGTAYCVSEHPAADESGTVAGFADATGRYLPLVCTLNATKVTDAVARLLDVSAAELDQLALAAPGGAGGVVLVPHLDGERFGRLSQGSARGDDPIDTPLEVIGTDRVVWGVWL